MKKILWKAYLYGPAAILLFFIIYEGGIKFESLNETGLIILTVLSGALSGFFHLYIVIWEGDKKVDMHQPTMKYCLIYRPPIAMAFTVSCYFWLFQLFLFIREQLQPVAPAIVVMICLLLGSFSYWILKFLAKVFGETLSTKKTIIKGSQKKKLYKSSKGGEIMDEDNQEKKEEQGEVVSLKEYITSKGGFWEWIKLLLLGFYLLIIPVIIVFFIIDFWPTAGAAPPAGNATMILELNLSSQLKMLLLVLLAGALGSYIHVATSFSYHIARRDYDPHWYWWYWMRLPIGAALALVFIMIFQGGIFAVQISQIGDTSAEPITTIGIAALIGLFSHQALEKLRDIFDVVFNPREKKNDK